jgi:hypothetical protein
LNTEIYQNGKLLCNSQAKYAEGDSSHMADSHGSTARHIASMTGCVSSDSVKAGDKFQIVVNYDFEKNPGQVFANMTFVANTLQNERQGWQIVANHGRCHIVYWIEVELQLVG